jgi:NADH dehydrogenase/NADH:ubiquinone oxidoreductase subunit G
LNVQRLIYPQLLIANKFIKFSWHKIFSFVAYALKSFKYNFIGAYCGPFTSLEGFLAPKSYLISMGCSNIHYINNYPLLTDFRLYYKLNDTLLGSEKVINNILFMGTNIRSEAPLINSRLRKNFLNNIEFKAYSIGLALNYTSYPIQNIGNSMKILYKFLEGRFFGTKYFINDYLNVIYFGYNLLDTNIFISTTSF